MFDCYNMLGLAKLISRIFTVSRFPSPDIYNQMMIEVIWHARIKFPVHLASFDHLCHFNILNEIVPKSNSTKYCQIKESIIYYCNTLYS